MRILNEIDLNLNQVHAHTHLTARQGEKNGRFIEATLYTGFKPFTIPPTFTATVDGVIDNQVVADSVPCEIKDNKVYIPITDYMCSFSGDLKLVVKLSKDESIVYSQDILIKVAKNPIDEGVNNIVAKINILEAELESAKTEIIRLEELLESTETAELMRQLEQKQQEVESLTLQLEQLNREKAVLESSNVQLQQENESLGIENQSLSQSNNALILENTNLTQINIQLQGDLSTANEEIQRLQEDLENAIVETQDKIVKIIKNGVSEVLPDENKALSKVTIEVEVPNNEEEYKAQAESEKKRADEAEAEVERLEGELEVANINSSLAIGLIDGSQKEIVVPNTVTSIKKYAFKYCTNLTSITIPDSVTSIGAGAFEDCESLKSVIIPDSVTEMTGDSYPPGVVADTFRNSGVETVILPKNIEFLPGYLFRAAQKLKRAEIPLSVNQIGRNFFDSCTSLEEITILNPNMEIIFIDTFTNSGCKALKKVNLPQDFNVDGLNVGYGDYEVEDILAMGNALYDRKSQGLSEYTLVIGSKNREKLDINQQLLFTSKGWNLA